jgi:hypothetical protein
MSNDCQKAVVTEDGTDWGPGKCEVKSGRKAQRAERKTCCKCAYAAEPGGCGESKGPDDTCEYFSPKS